MAEMSTKPKTYTPCLCVQCTHMYTIWTNIWLATLYVCVWNKILRINKIQTNMYMYPELGVTSWNISPAPVITWRIAEGMISPLQNSCHKLCVALISVFFHLWREQIQLPGCKASSGVCTPLPLPPPPPTGKVHCFIAPIYWVHWRTLAIIAHLGYQNTSPVGLLVS